MITLTDIRRRALASLIPPPRLRDLAMTIVAEVIADDRTAS